MSTFATAVVVDVPAESVPAVANALTAKATEHDNGLPAEVTSVYVQPVVEWVRISAYLPFQAGLIDEIGALISSAGQARAVIAEDNDEYGACWAVLAADGGTTRTVHRRYILNADPADPEDVGSALADFEEEGDPRIHDVAGTGAVTATAILFGVDPAQVVEAETSSDAAWQELGTVGGPFPWWDALGLIWPGPEAGTPYVAPTP